MRTQFYSEHETQMNLAQANKITGESYISVGFKLNQKCGKLCMKIFNNFTFGN